MFKDLAIIVLVFLGIYFFTTAAFSKDGWEGRPHVCSMAPGPRLEQCQAWISTVNRPDYRGARCCGDGDAYIVDDFELVKETGELYAVVSGDYYSPDGSLFLSKGQKILIPQEKINTSQDDAGNTSGHGVLFLNNFTKEILCYFFPPLT